MSHKTLIVIAGPTAAGKTALAVSLAKVLGTEVVSADSRQVYREMKVGTARPSAEELQGIPYHLAGHRSIRDEYNTATYEQEALHALDTIFGKKDNAILAGGTGLYIDAVCEGLDAMPEGDTGVRAELEQLLREKGIEVLQQELQERDPAYFAKADSDNPRRLIRAIEVCRLTGKPYSALRKGKGKTRPFRTVKIALDMNREKLYARINSRTEQMLAGGLEKEARKLYPYKELPALDTIGYKEFFDYFEKKYTYEEAVGKIRQYSRNYAKRQLSWFRRDNGYHWFDPGDTNEIITYITGKLNA